MFRRIRHCLRKIAAKCLDKPKMRYLSCSVCCVIAGSAPNGSVSAIASGGRASPTRAWNATRSGRGTLADVANVRTFPMKSPFGADDAAFFAEAPTAEGTRTPGIIVVDGPAHGSALHVERQAALRIRDGPCIWRLSVGRRRRRGSNEDGPSQSSTLTTNMPKSGPKGDEKALADEIARILGKPLPKNRVRRLWPKWIAASLMPLPSR